MISASALWDVDAECAVLGALFHDNSVLDRLPQLDASHFHFPPHAALWLEAVRIARTGVIADPITLRPWWLAQPFAEELGRAQYLLALMDKAARITAFAIDYAETLRELASRRQLQRIASDALSMIQKGASSLDVASTLEAAVQGIGAARQSASVSIVEAWDMVMEDLGKPMSPAARFGFDVLDNHLGGLFASDLVILAGRPAMGKTSLATNIAVNTALRGGVVHFASCEMSAKSLAERIGSRLTQVYNYSDLRKPDYRPSPERLSGARALFPHGLRVDQTGGQTVAHLEAQARATRQRYGALNLVVVDYLQLMTVPGSKENRTQEVSAVTMGLKNLAKRLDVPVLALSQLSRQVEARDDKRPQLSDLRESGSIEQDADSVLFGYRDEYYLRQREPKPKEGESKSDFDIRFHRWHDALEASRGIMEVIVAKNRHGQVGSERLRFDPPKDTVSNFEGRTA
jgi:replicative DNA helicase